MYILGLIVLLFNGVFGFWVVDINKTTGDYGYKWANVFDLETASVNTDGTVHTLCTFGFGYNDTIQFNDNEYGGCQNVSTVALVTENSTLLYLKHEDNSKIGCLLSDSDDMFDSYLCADKFPVASLTTQTTTTTEVTAPTIINTSSSKATSIKTTSTKTTSSKPTTTTSGVKPTATCTSGYSGKSNGGGSTGACCKTSDDCEDTCTKGVCGIHP